MAYRFKEILREAKSVPCMDCGVQYPPYVMDADHRDRDDRKFSLSRATADVTEEQFMEELAKCDIICANCHRIRTYKNGGFFPRKQKETMDVVLAGSGQRSY